MRKLFLPLLLLITSACATTSTQLGTVSSPEIQAEQRKQQVLWLQTVREQQQRLDDTAQPILTGGLPLCGADTARVAGFRYANLHGYNEDWHEAVVEEIALGDTLEVVAVTRGSAAERSGLQVGDHLLSFAGHWLHPGPEAMRLAGEWFERFRASGGSEIHVLYRRNGEKGSTVIEADLACSYAPSLIQDESLNAFADGEAVYVTTGMMRYASDRDLAAIIAHEFAHNAMGHLAAKKTNARAGAIFGALGDVAMGYAGVNTGGYFTSKFASLGAITYSQDFEREADYVSMYALALAGLPLESAPELWRSLAVANPGSIGLASSHPTSAERFVRLKQIAEEIEIKRAQGAELLPNMRPE